MRGRARKEGEVWSADIGELAVGRSRLAGDFRYDPTPAVPKLTGKLGGALLSLPDLGPAVGAPPTKPGAGKEKRTEDKVAENKNAEDRPASSTEKSAGNDKQRGSGQTQVSGSAGAAPNGGSEAGPAERDPNAKRPGDEAAGHRTTPARRVLPQKEFNTPSLAAMEADVQIELQEFDLGTAQLEELKPFHGHLTLHDRVLTLEKLKAGAAGGEMSGVISFDARAKTPQWNADLGWAGVQLQRFVKPRDVVGRDPQSGYVSGALSGRARLSGHGRSTAAILGSLDGGVQLWVRNGTISHLLVEALGIDVAQALGVLVRGDAQLQMNCAVTSMSVRDGRMDPDVALIETKDSTLTTTGFISLADERLGLEFRAHPKDVSPMTLRSPLYVEGTFSDPAIRIDKRRIGLRVAAAAALAAVTPIAGALALIDLGDSERDACQKAYARVQSPTPASRPGNRTPR
nr:AsmA family protein [Propionivibrio soli]